MDMNDIRKWKKITEDHDMEHGHDDAGVHDHEASMARGQLYHIAKDAIKMIQNKILENHHKYYYEIYHPQEYALISHFF